MTIDKNVAALAEHIGEVLNITTSSLTDLTTRAETAAALAVSSNGLNSLDDLVSDVNLSYSTLEAGDQIKAGVFTFKVAPVGTADTHIQTSGGVLLYAMPGSDGYCHITQFGGIYGDISYAYSNGIAAQTALDYCGAGGYGLDFGHGVFFNSEPLVQRMSLKCRFGTVDYAQKQYTGTVQDIRPSDFVMPMVGTGSKDQTLFGVSSCRAWGGRRVNPSPVSGYNDEYYELRSYVNESTSASDRSLKQFSAAWSVGTNAAWGSTWEGLRMFPFAGGDDGMDDWKTSDRTVTKALSEGDWDVGFFIQSLREFSMKHVQVVGQWRDCGVLLAPHAKDFSTGSTVYNSAWDECTIGSIAIRSVDSAPISKTTSDTIEIPWADDHPFGADGDMVALLSVTGRSGDTFTYTDMEKDTSGAYDVLRLTGVSPDPTGYKIARVDYRGGGSSHTNFNFCEFQGFGHGSNEPSENVDLGGVGQGFSKPRAIVEISGNELTEINFDKSIVTGYETVAVHMFDCRHIRLPTYWEMNGGTAGRILASGPRDSNTDAVGGVAASETLDVFFDPLGSTITDGSLDYRPYIRECEISKRFTGDSDDGLFTPVKLRSPRFGSPHTLDTGAFLAAPYGGVAGIGRYTDVTGFFEPSHNDFDAALYYDDGTNVTRVRKNIVSNTAGQSDLGALGSGAYGAVVAHRHVSFEVSVEDNAVGTVAFPEGINGCIVAITCNPSGNLPLNAHSGMLFADSGSSLVVQRYVGGGSLQVLTTVTGTSGTDGNTTVGVQSGALDIENRSGATRTYSVTFLG